MRLNHRRRRRRFAILVLALAVGLAAVAPATAKGPVFYPHRCPERVGLATETHSQPWAVCGKLHAASATGGGLADRRSDFGGGAALLILTIASGNAGGNPPPKRPTEASPPPSARQEENDNETHRHSRPSSCRHAVDRRRPRAGTGARRRYIPRRWTNEAAPSTSKCRRTAPGCAEFQVINQ